MRSKKILITGGSGMVGSCINFGIKPPKKELNILDKKSIQKSFLKYKPEAVIHLAGMVNMIECEKDKKRSYLMNKTGTQNIAEACKKYGSKMIYVSTCAVFSGKKKTPYNEKDLPKPINQYGKSKRAGEIVSQKILKDVIIVRTGWLFGKSKTSKKFVTSIYQKTKDGTLVEATSDRYGSPTYIPDLVDELRNLISANRTGIYHIVNNGTASYYDIAKEIKKQLKSKTRLVKAKSKDMDGEIKRGKMEALKTIHKPMRHWKLAMLDYLKSIGYDEKQNNRRGKNSNKQ